MNRLLLALLLLLTLTSGTVVTPDIIILDSTADLQDAIDNATTGSILTLGPGEYDCDSDSGFVIRKPLTLRGSGRNGTYGTILRPHQLYPETPNRHAAGVLVYSDDVTIEHLLVANEYQPSAAGTGHGIWVNDSLLTATTISRVTLRDVAVAYMGGDGIRCDGRADSIKAVKVAGADLRFNNGDAAAFYDCYGLDLSGIVAEGNGSDDVEGLLLYDTSLNKFKFWNGTAYETVTSAVP